MVVPYTPISVEVSGSLSSNIQSILSIEDIHVYTDLKSETEIDVFGPHHVCHICFEKKTIHEKNYPNVFNILLNVTFHDRVQFSGFVTFS